MDPEAMVRIAAVRALAVTDDQRVPPVLAAHLTDSSRLVRVAAVEALLARGIARLDGPAGQALARAQDDWADSLRSFNDVAANHTVLGWLDASRGRADEASTELRTAIAMDPADARPHVYLGVVAARAGRFDEALQHFKDAKALQPGYQNLDRLIDEAEKRATKR
jgi:Flp pilus assembly protein TadD